MAGLVRQGPAAVAKPGVEFNEGADALLGGIDPDAQATVLHDLLDRVLLPAADNVSDVGVDQVVRAHHVEALVDHAALDLPDLVHGRFHAVVDSVPGKTAHPRPRPSVS